MREDTLVSILKFIRLNVGLLIVLLAFFAVVIWGGVRYVATRNTVSSEAQIAAILATPTPSAVATQSAHETATVKPSATPVITPTVTPTPKATTTVLPSPKATATPTTTPKITPQALPQVSPSVTPVATPTLKATSSPASQKTIVPSPKTTVSPTPTASQDGRSYVTVKGDSSWKVAEKLMGNGYLYPLLEKANHLKHNQHLQVGQKLVIPEHAVTATDPARSKIASGVSITEKTTTITQSPAQGQTGKTYVVQKGDSLWNIAKKEMGNPYAWVALYKANKKVIGSNPHLIYPDTTLTIPPTTPTSLSK